MGLRLAFIGSINDQILNRDELATELLRFLMAHYPDSLKERYQMEDQDAAQALRQIAKIRGCLMKGGEPDLSKAAGLLIDDFRSGKLGRITLEFPPASPTGAVKADEGADGSCAE